MEIISIERSTYEKLLTNWISQEYWGYNLGYKGVRIGFFKRFRKIILSMQKDCTDFLYLCSDILLID